MSPASLAKVIAVSMILLPGMVHAQSGNPAIDPITLVVGPAYLMPTGPEYAATGDLDNDGLVDAVIASTRDDFVSALLSDGQGGFRTLITMPVSNKLGDVTTLDFNSDGNLDIAAIDQRGGIDIMSGLGNGAFNPPLFLKGDRLGQGIKAGNFDNQNGPDIATANGRSKNISVFINRGGNLGYQPALEYGVGGNVIGDDISIADFNSDTFDDIAVLNTRLREADEISLLINNTRAQFNTVTKFLVNQRAVAIADGDWNNDGIPDLVSLEQGQQFVNQIQKEFSITVLVNRTRVVNDRLVGTGIFQTMASVPVSCPGLFNGVPILCKAEDIESGDFNGDGFDDLAVSISTTTVQDIGLATPGLIQAFLGLGNGTFVFSTRVNVGLKPRGIATGDTTGNLLDDVIVTEFRAVGFDPSRQDLEDNDARIVRAIPPPPKGNGVPCIQPSQCESGNCTDNVCCRDPLCPEGQRCDIPGFEGVCHAPGDPGDDCETGDQCASGYCVNQFCCTSPSCPAGEFCNTGVCGPPAPPGSNCNMNEQCNPAYCVNGTCCNMPACPFGQRCDIPPFEGMCHARLGIGEPCVEDGQCADNLFCTDNVCCTSQNCGPGRACDVPGREGICSTLPTPTPTATRTPTPQANGSNCTKDEECLSGNCVDGACCASPKCPDGQFCNISSAPGICTPKIPQGGDCTKNSDCTTGNCVNGTCGPPFTPTPLKPGDPCDTTSQCQAGFECNVVEGRLCCEDLVCPPGTSCRLPGKEGFCFNLPTPTPTRLPNGARCPDGSVCQSENCVNDVCCQTASCQGSDRCDIFGFDGSCVPPLPEGSICLTNSDCAPGLACLVDNFGVRRCTVVRATPTFIPTQTPSPTLQPTIIVDRDDGGCSIDNERRSGSAWMLAFFPLFLGLRRYQVAEIVVRARR